MNQVKKKFSRALYEKSDKKAKDVIRKYLQSKGHTLKKDEEKFACDIEGEDHGWEVEIKYSWKGDWPTAWEDVRIPCRKERLLKQKGKENITFYVLNSECNQAWEITGEAVSSSNRVEVPNRFVPEGELFFSILVSNATKIFLDI